MQTGNFDILPYADAYQSQVLAVWEKSVLATHGFLTPADFEEIKELVSHIDFSGFQVFCLTAGSFVIGFIGVVDHKVEMLFLDPSYFGQGLGRKLLDFAVEKLHANQLDVNEQNTKALQFYQRFGFEVFERTDQDDQGRNYPLLRMRLAETNKRSKNLENNS
ncbi:MAG TPA: GNAT family N-acetyltransferase [Flavipsychrobacter sp.]|nr:GNAT family N-acetyltransferase [Flavipsychrobacter sp.]